MVAKCFLLRAELLVSDVRSFPRLLGCLVEIDLALEQTARDGDIAAVRRIRPVQALDRGDGVLVALRLFDALGFFLGKDLVLEIGARFGSGRKIKASL